MAFWNWSKTPATNATATGGTWAEGQAPSSINDSFRINAAELASYRDDIAGAIVTGGSSTAYTVTSFEVFDTLAHMNGQMIAFTPHATNGATVTLNVDGLGAKPLRSSPGVELPAGVLIQGTPYEVVYNNVDAVFYLRGFFGNAYNIPIGGCMPFFGNTGTPNSSFVFPYAQAISRTTYSALFALTGTAYGPGDGSTTFNLPDLRGRGLFGRDDMGGSAANRITNAGSSIVGTTLGASGGAETVTLGTTNLPAQTPSGTVNTGTVAFNNANIASASGGGTGNITTGGFAATGALSLNAATISGFSFTGTAFAGQNSTPVNKMPPALICNFIIRII